MYTRYVQPRVLELTPLQDSLFEECGSTCTCWSVLRVLKQLQFSIAACSLGFSFVRLATSLFASSEISRPRPFTPVTRFWKIKKHIKRLAVKTGLKIRQTIIHWLVPCCCWSSGLSSVRVSLFSIVSQQWIWDGQHAMYLKPTDGKQC